MKKSHSFSKRLSLGVLTISLLILSTTLLVAGFSSHKLITDEATKSAVNLLNASISEIENKLQIVEMSVQTASWIIGEIKYDEESLYRLTNAVVSDNPFIMGSAIAYAPEKFDERYYFSPYSYTDSETGKVKSKQLGTVDNDYFHQDWYQIPFLLGKGGWSEPYYDEGGAQELMSTYSCPVKDENGEVYAVITGDISLKWISDILSNIKPYPHSNIMVTTPCSNFVYSSSKGGHQGETLYSLLDYATGEKIEKIDKIVEALSHSESGTMTFKRDNRESFAVYGPMSNGWELCITCDHDDILSRTKKMNVILSIMGILGILVLTVLSYIAVRSMTRPLLKISESAEIIASGNFNAELPEIKSDDEIGQLRDSFENMQKSLRDYVSELKRTTAANEKYENELNIARVIQGSMLKTEFPHSEHVDVHAMMTPAKEVGGDFYDAFIKDDVLYFAIGDVSGKGIPASLYMSFTTAAFRLIAAIGMNLDDVMRRINNMMSESNNLGMFITMFVGSLNLKTGEFSYCNAGHNPLVLIGPDGKPSLMKSVTNIATGLFFGFDYKMETRKLEKGSQLVLYTDGVTEAERADKSQYGEDRLLSWAENIALKDISSETTCQNLYREVKLFTDGNMQNDDITIMSIKFA